MIYVYVPRNAKECQYPFAEVEDGLPVHPGDLQARVRSLIASGKPWATQSDIVVSMLGWMIRKGEIKPPVRLACIDAKGELRENKFDVKGDLIMPWPEEGFDSIQEAAFYYRYD